MSLSGGPVKKFKLGFRIYLWRKMGQTSPPIYSPVVNFSVVGGSSAGRPSSTHSFMPVPDPQSFRFSFFHHRSIAHHNSQLPTPRSGLLFLAWQSWWKVFVYFRAHGCGGRVVEKDAEPFLAGFLRGNNSER